MSWVRLQHVTAQLSIAHEGLVELQEAVMGGDSKASVGASGRVATGSEHGTQVLSRGLRSNPGCQHRERAHPKSHAPHTVDARDLKDT